jgi:PadR family transcriptional regulator PadR
MRLERDLMRGVGPAAVMRLLAGGERYGYELVDLLTRQTDGVLSMGQSTLYPLLYNLEAKKLITSRLDQTGPRPRRYYRLTAKGKRTLATKEKQLQAVAAALVGLGILRPEGGAA